MIVEHRLFHHVLEVFKQTDRKIGLTIFNCPLSIFHYNRFVVSGITIAQMARRQVENPDKHRDEDI